MIMCGNFFLERAGALSGPFRVYRCIDIGGTKMATALSDGRRVWDLHVYPVSRTRKALLDQVLSLSEGEYPVLIGSPGKFQNGRIVPGTANNLGAFPGECDGLDFGAHIYAHTGLSVDVYNDALAQMAGGYRLLYDSGVFPVSVELGYVGIGTGLGGGFATCVSGHVLPFTDGHIFDVLLEGQLAEALLSGRAFYTQTGVLAREAARTPERYRDILSVFGYRLALLLRYFYAGTAEKPSSHDAWSTADRAQVRGVRTYMIGGGLGSAQPFGEWLCGEARSFLAQWQLPIVLHVLPDSVSAALLGLVVLKTDVIVS